MQVPPQLLNTDASEKKQMLTQMFLRIGLGSIISLALKNYLWMGCAGLPMSSWEADTCEDGLTQPKKMLKTTPGLSCSVQAPCRERWNLSWPFNWHVPSWQNIKEDATQKRHDFRKELPIYGMHEDMGQGSQPCVSETASPGPHGPPAAWPRSALGKKT